MDHLQKQRSGTSSASSDEHFQSNTNRKDFGWLHFDNEPSNKCRTNSLAYPFLCLIQYLQVVICSTSLDMTKVFHRRLNCEFTEIIASLDMTKVFHKRLHSQFIEIEGNLKRKKLHWNQQVNIQSTKSHRSNSSS